MSLNNLLREIPRVDDLINSISNSINLKLSHDVIKMVVNEYLDELRLRIKNNEVDKIDTDQILDTLILKLTKLQSTKFMPVINATGVVIHTNLGRSTISKDILLKSVDVLSGYNNLEFDLENGVRGTRYAIVESLLCNLTGAEAALVVNNNAAAVMLVLNTLAKNKEVIVSRGELVEIGGAFRIPEVMSMSGCVLKEIGTTNKTHLYDYEKAITDETALLLKVHTSNYKVLGFTKSVESVELSELAQKHNIPIYEDLGSGLLIELEKFGFSKEPIVQDIINSNVDVVSFSGDKLLGASQCGIIVGKKSLIDEMKKNQLLRALRIDKFSLSVLELTLLEYLNPKTALTKIDTLKRLTMSSAEILESIKDFMKVLEEKALIAGKDTSNIEIKPLESEVGGGSFPLEKLSSFGLFIKTDKASKIQSQLRRLQVPIIVRIIEDEVVFDFRTISTSEFTGLSEDIVEIALRCKL